MSGRRASDWLPFTPKRESDGERRGEDRRAGDRRAPKRRIDPLFAATLLNQIVPEEASCPLEPYRARPPLPRPGVVTNSLV
jgi:hypothetical protein